MHPNTKRFLTWPVPLALLLLHGAAQASCGSAFCTVNTYWDTQGLSNSAGLNIDLRYSYAKADRLLAGSQRITPATPSGSDGEIENGRTVNQLLDLEADYALNDRWNVAIGVPLVMRDHLHTFDSAISGPFAQQARFTSLGDVRVVGKYKFDTGNPLAGGGIRVGLKLPTGSIGKTMSPPDPAAPTVPYALERSAQPGTGSTDVILGAYRFGSWPASQWGWFASGQLQSAIATRDGYRPGRQVQVDLGLNYAFSTELMGLLQLNLQQRARDTGENANPASGGSSLNLSPGLSYAVSPQSRVYAFVQKAIFQRVNTDPATGAGQLVAPWSVAVGVSRSF
ncbi:MAG: hypothetical protein JWQ33_1097 [Ramlibacter sp.]|nr:hypothetical protein [Ramlibacter sp.]